jgi:hypothetical protein
MQVSLLSFFCSVVVILAFTDGDTLAFGVLDFVVVFLVFITSIYTTCIAYVSLSSEWNKYQIQYNITSGIFSVLIRK